MSELPAPDDDLIAAARAEAGRTDVLRPDHAHSIEAAGDVIDQYRLVEEVGEGGMGTVWRAQQVEPVTRDVALKIVKLGMDTREVVKRFEGERQALAMMDHPHIAKVLDGGATAGGRPYFVMELVDGVPVTDHCAREALPIRERVELFIQVAEAIQHAHQKGVIHRDIKPSNVLVARQDEGASPRIIDFGIAKATGGETNFATMLTEQGRIVGTPEYMSPEQATLDGGDVDTRADVYSLGVLLYELLTGTKPFDVKEALSGGFQGLLQVIREVDPDRPSTRVSTTGLLPEGLGRLSIDVSVLSRRLRGDLDWIVMRALEKDRERRYQSPADLAEDLRRFLAREPVEAAPPSTWYRLSRFVARRRKTVAALAAIVLALVLGLAGTGYGLQKSRTANDRLETANLALGKRIQERDEALADLRVQSELAARELDRARQFKAVVVDLFTGVHPEVARGKDTELLEELLGRSSESSLAGRVEDPEVALDVHTFLSDSYLLIAGYGRSELHAKEGVRLAEELYPAGHAARLNARDALGNLRFAQGQVTEAIELYSAVAAGHRASDDEQRLLESEVLLRLARAQIVVGDVDAARATLDELFELEARLGLLGDGPRLEAQTKLGMVLISSGGHGEAIEALAPALAEMEESLGDDHPVTLDALGVLAAAHLAGGELDRAAELTGVQLARMEGVLAEDHPVRLAARARRARVLARGGQHEQALEILGDVTAKAEVVLGAEHRDLCRWRVARGRSLAAVGRHEEAIAELEPASEAMARTEGVGARRRLTALRDLGDALAAMQRDAEALTTLLELEALAEEHLEPSDALTLDVKLALGDLLAAADRLDEAILRSEDALALRRSISGDDHPDTINTQFILAGRCMMASRIPDAITHFEEVLPRAKAVLGDEARQTLGTMTNLGACYGMEGRLDEGIALLEASTEAKGRVLGTRDPYTGSAFRQLDRLYRAAGRTEDADGVERRLMMLQSQEILALADRWQIPDGFARSLLGRDEVDDELAELAVTMARRAVELAGPEETRPLSTLAAALHAAGDVQGAVQTIESALRALPEGRMKVRRRKLEAQLEEYSGR